MRTLVLSCAEGPRLAQNVRLTSEMDSQFPHRQRY